MFADTPEPPYYAVIFSSLQSDNLEGYWDELERIRNIAVEQPGFLGIESVRGEDGFGMTVVFYDSLDNIDKWRRHPEHGKAKAKGRSTWYDGYRIRIAKVESAGAFDRAPAA